VENENNARQGEPMANIMTIGKFLGQIVPGNFGGNVVKFYE